jgi:CheY-like chemotaxis protein
MTSAPPLSRILVVDDEPDLRNLLRLCLVEVGGYGVDLCSSGPDALARLETDRPDLILMDVMMPGLDGPATLAALRDRGLGTPVVFLTAKVQAPEVAALKAQGALGVIAKPFDPMTLADEVRALWEAHHG